MITKRDAKNDIKQLKLEIGNTEYDNQQLKDKLSNEQQKDDQIQDLRNEVKHMAKLAEVKEIYRADEEQKRKQLELEVTQTVKENAKLLEAIEANDSEMCKMNKQMDQKNLELQDLTMKYIGTQEQKYLDMTSQAPSQTQIPKTAQLLMDSNGKRIKP